MAPVRHRGGEARRVGNVRPEVKPTLIYPDASDRSYCVEVQTNPKGIHVQRRFASHGCQVPWAVMRAALRRHDRRATKTRKAR
jgi:hypothetical protein